MSGMPDRYLRPGWFTRNGFNRIVAALTRLGVSVLGSRVLEVRGRTSGEPRRVPVNLLTFEGERYLVAPRGATQWVRNLRASGGEGRCGPGLVMKLDGVRCGARRLERLLVRGWRGRWAR